MNKALEKLAAQSLVWVDTGLADGREQIFSTQKFAELIVRECMDNLAWHGHDEAVNQLEWFRVNKLGMK
jgi:hypothetical protein